MQSRALTFFITISFLLIIPIFGYAHEQWFLTPQQYAILAAEPKPAIFTTLTSANVTILLFSTIFLIGWISLHYTGANELFPDLQSRLAAYGDWVSVILRITTSVMLLMASLGLSPRHGTDMYVAPTLIAPDLELRLAGSHWGWIALIEIIISILFIFGIYVRFGAFLLLLISCFGFYLFGNLMFAYAGIVMGIGFYLLLQGPGHLYLPLPFPPGLNKIQKWLETQSRDRATIIIRILTGLNLAFLGIAYKFMHPNLDIGILNMVHAFTFGLEPATFTFIMMLTELIAGLLLIAGFLMRPTSLFLLFCFIFLAEDIREPLICHIIIYGTLLCFFINGAGRWSRATPKDKPAHILILGNDLSAIHAALKLEKLLGDASNIKVTLISNQNYMQFNPLLPEVISGALQPGSILNPIRRICRRTHFIQAEINTIDTKNDSVTIKLLSGESKTLVYDQLIIGFGLEINLTALPGLFAHGKPIGTIGDALLLRQEILECLEEATVSTDAAKRKKLLTFAVIGAGLRGVSTAAELRSFLNTALISYPNIDPAETQVYLFEKCPSILPSFDSKLSQLAHRRLIKMGVIIEVNTIIHSITANEVVFNDDLRLAYHIAINTISAANPILTQLPDITNDGSVSVNDYLQAKSNRNVFVIGNNNDLPFKKTHQVLRETKMGRLAALNAWSNSQGYTMFALKNKKPFMFVLALGRNASVTRLFNISINGITAWFFSHLICLVTLPGLERNLRILIDWLFDIPFRRDIVTISPRVTLKIVHAHYEANDYIIHEGEPGSDAFFIQSGEVEVLKKIKNETQQIAILKAGEFFGEIALLTNMPRTASIRCLTPVNVVILDRNQLNSLLVGFKMLAEELKKIAEKRMKNI